MREPAAGARFAIANERGCSIAEIGITAGQLAELAKMLSESKVNASASAKIFDRIIEAGGSAEAIAAELGLLAVSDSGQVEQWADQAIAANPGPADQVRTGDRKAKQAFGFLMGSVTGRLVSVERAPFRTIAHLESSNTNTPKVQTDVILFDSQKKIEFINHVQKKAVYTKEAVYFAFPFAGDNPQVRYDLQNGFVDPTRDLLPGADREWFSVQHWASFQSGDVTQAIIPEDAELFTLGDIVRGKWSTELTRAGARFFPM